MIGKARTDMWKWPAIQHLYDLPLNEGKRVQQLESLGKVHAVLRTCTVSTGKALACLVQDVVMQKE